MKPSLPLVTFVLVTVNLLVYAQELLIGGHVLCDTKGLIPARLEPAALITSLFLHDPSNLSHLLGNMAFLAFFGTLVERKLGHLSFLGLYLAAGVFGGLLHTLVDPTSTAALVGASGAIFGVVAMAAALYPRLVGFVVVFVGIEIWHAFTGTGGSVSFGCHLGGFVAGFIVAAVMRATGSEALEAE